MLGLVLGGLFSAVAVAIAEASDSNIRDIRDLPTFGDAPILGSIPNILNASDRRRRRLLFLSWTAAYGAAIFIVGATVVAALK